MDLPQIAQLFRWQHPLAGEAHALLRAAYDPATGQAVAVVSELADNPDDRGITYDFSSVAEAALPLLRAKLSPQLSSVLWIAHFGDFSYHYVPGPESFTAVGLKVTGNGYADDLQGDRRLTEAEVTALFGGQPLAPVAEVLAGLDPLT
ncbi:hypothetical protein OOK31_14090 [Streptomyces sp. NBC_00249]|uniref:hypothetical protein n=1 Tax=Streptomyces sp. NBC_00249 TaxID=2975690 RepID=UPI00225645D4|nr:hypothetical protein [Streptomyces sp. NBC_00249]MCX5195021.1 hypothetical protein [Streptomyces sp. NBC_00249]